MKKRGFFRVIYHHYRKTRSFFDLLFLGPIVIQVDLGGKN